jgi:alpha-D-xyloside xylohydrolase
MTLHGYTKNSTGLEWRRNGEYLRIEAFGPDSLRVRATLNTDFADDQPHALLPPVRSKPVITLSDTGGVIRNGRIEARVDKTGMISFHNSRTGELLTRETKFQFQTPSRSYLRREAGRFSAEVFFEAFKDEKIFGLGQNQNRLLDQKGTVLQLMQRNTQVTIPFALSSRGYGFLWNNPAIGRAEFGTNRTCWVAESTRQIDYWITAGDTPAQINAAFVDAVGHASQFPSWASGFWQCKLRYKTQDELLAVAREYRRRKLPLDVIVIDFFHWTKQGEWTFDRKCWPDPRGMVKELEAMGVKLMVSVWPTVSIRSAANRTFEEHDWLATQKRGGNNHLRFFDTDVPGRVSVNFYDATNPEARAYLAKQLKENYIKYGIDIFWLDACEPEIMPHHFDNIRFSAGDALEVANIYPKCHEQGIFDGMKKAGIKTPLNLCRSAWVGSQQYGAAVWSGDIASTFEALAVQIRAGLNMALSGIPYWTTDIGGFHEGNITTPYFRELIVRWFQYGAFCPIFRLHGSRQPPNGDRDADNEVWSFGETAYGIISRLLHMRERLRPYIMRQAHRAARDGTPIMRPLFYDFPEDPAAWTIDDQFLFGPDILVAPVTESKQRARRVYLPLGATWTHAVTGRAIRGGTTVTDKTPLGNIPVYFRNKARFAAISEALRA